MPLSGDQPIRRARLDPRVLVVPIRTQRQQVAAGRVVAIAVAASASCGLPPGRVVLNGKGIMLVELTAALFFWNGTADTQLAPQLPLLVGLLAEQLVEL